jgi:hypothetical protein
VAERSRVWKPICSFLGDPQDGYMDIGEV